MVNLSTERQSVRYLVISADSAGQRVDNFLITQLKGVPRTHLYRIVRKGEVRVNKGRIKPDYRLKAGDSLRIPPLRYEEKPKDSSALPPKNKALMSCILYEDEGLIVLNKPAGIAVHGGSGISFGVIESFRKLRPQQASSLELVHRLDKDTSGCLMIAKRRSTLKWLHELLRTGQVHKIYLALVKGEWLGKNCVDVSLFKNQLSSGERIVRVDASGQTAYTEFQSLQSFTKATLVEAKPLTGRTHQIRVHATFAGHPLACDPKYGDSEFNSEMKAMGLNRLFLHAKAITLPLSESESLTIEAPLDKPLSKILAALSGEQHHV